MFQFLMICSVNIDSDSGPELNDSFLSVSSTASGGTNLGAVCSPGRLIYMVTINR